MTDSQNDRIYRIGKRILIGCFIIFLLELCISQFTFPGDSPIHPPVSEGPIDHYHAPYPGCGSFC